MNLRFVYITCKDQEQAAQIGRALVAERLAACANIIDPMRSFYWWDGQIQDDQECVLIAKTRADRMEALVDRVRALHSYEVPCVVGLPIEAGNPDYLNWVAEEAAAE